MCWFNLSKERSDGSQPGEGLISRYQLEGDVQFRVTSRPHVTWFQRFLTAREEWRLWLLPFPPFSSSGGSCVYHCVLLTQEAHTGPLL